MKQILFILIFALSAVSAVEARQNFLITSDSAGNVRLGMTISQARKALKGFTLKRTTDGDGAALIGVSKNGKDIMNLYAGEEDPDSKINENARIEFIEVWDQSYKTANGIHPKMLVKNAEKILGKVERIFMSEIESREFSIFRKKPKGLSFRIDVSTTGKYLNAGIYTQDKRQTVRYAPTAYILSIQISKYWSENDD